MGKFHFLFELITSSCIILGVSASEQPQVCNDLLPCDSPTEICSDDGFCTLNNTNINEICSSVSPRQVYDEFNKRCSNQVGEDCKVDEDCQNLSNCLPEWDSNSNGFVGKCVCGANFYLNVTTGTCEKRAKYGEFCSDELPCELTHFLSCQSGQCHCMDPHKQTYDFDKDSCVLKLEENCYDYRRHIKSICGLHAECVFHFHARKTPKCKCVKGYIQTLEGTCKADYGTPCKDTVERNINETETSNPCAEERDLVCSDGICQCNSPLSQRFDLELKKCVKIVESFCNVLSLPLKECGSHASCIGNVCQCDKGYSKTSLGTCHLDFGERCDHSSSKFCNSDAGLSCRNGICRCFDLTNLIYDSDTKVCRLSQGKKNSPCGTTEDSLLGIKYQIRCPKGLECIKHSGCFCNILGHPHYKEKELCIRNYL